MTLDSLRSGAAKPKDTIAIESNGQTCFEVVICTVFPPGNASLEIVKILNLFLLAVAAPVDR
jgi:hypothetical protein